MHPYFSTQVQPWQTFNPIYIGMYQRPSPWFDPSAYQAFNPAPYRGAFPGFETNPYYANNPYYAGIVPRPVFPTYPPVSFSPEMAHGMPPIGFPGFGISQYLSPKTSSPASAKPRGTISLLSSWSFYVRSYSDAAK